MLQTLHLLSSAFPLTLSPQTPSLSPSIHKPISVFPLSCSPRPRPGLFLARAQESESSIIDDEGPIELFQSSPSIFATSDDPSPLQVSTSVLLTGAISVFLFRSLRRRAKRAKELRLRSSETKKTLKEEALANLKAMGAASIKTKTKKDSPAQAFLGSLAAGVIALILFKFTTTIEASLSRQTLSDNFSVRQISITIRTIVNGLCYLATFVFGINAVGLFLYSGQLAMNSFMEDGSGKGESEVEEKLAPVKSGVTGSVEESELISSKENSPDDTQ